MTGSPQLETAGLPDADGAQSPGGRLDESRRRIDPRGHGSSPPRGEQGGPVPNAAHQPRRFLASAGWACSAPPHRVCTSLLHVSEKFI
jgi:hypothetical protein